MKTIDCVECGESVAHGRLSCPACGALLASVVGRSAPIVPVASPAEPVPVAASASPEPLETRGPDPASEPAETPSLWPPLDEVPEPILTPRTYRPPTWAGVTVAAEPSAPRAAAPGAYRPPTFSLAAAGASIAMPAWPDASGLGVRNGGTAESEGKAPVRAIEAARFVEIAGWFVVVGSTLALLGFFLPWSRTVIGAASYGDYFDAWGLANPTHLLALAGLLVVLALGIVRTPVPTWIRTGVLGLGLGALLVGLVWPYLVGPLGADVGVLCVGFGGVAMVIGGSVACWATRHGEVAPVV